MIVFTFRDACPNTVIESALHGLSVLCMQSGGFPDITDHACRLGHVDAFGSGNYRVSRYEWEFLAIDSEGVLGGLLNVRAGLSGYSARVRPRFEVQFDIQRVVSRYVPVRERC